MFFVKNRYDVLDLPRTIFIQIMGFCDDLQVIPNHLELRFLMDRKADC